jgi:hypothetical protein
MIMIVLGRVERAWVWAGGEPDGTLLPRQKNGIDPTQDMPVIGFPKLASRLCFTMTLATLFSGGISPLASQEAGGFWIRSQSDLAELSEPNGFGGYASVPLAEWLQLRASYDRVSQDSKEEGEVCFHYAPNWGCGTELVETSTSLGSLRLSLLPTFRLGELLRMEAGGGISFSQISATSMGESGRKANLESPKGGQLGYVALVSMGLTPIRRLPLTLVGTASSHWVGFEHCVSYEEVYDPFCGTTNFSEITVGLALHF